MKWEKTVETLKIKFLLIFLLFFMNLMHIQLCKKENEYECSNNKKLIIIIKINGWIYWIYEGETIDFSWLKKYI